MNLILGLPHNSINNSKIACYKCQERYGNSMNDTTDTAVQLISRDYPWLRNGKLKYFCQYHYLKNRPIQKELFNRAKEKALKLIQENQMNVRESHQKYPNEYSFEFSHENKCNVCEVSGSMDLFISCSNEEDEVQEEEVEDDKYYMYLQLDHRNVFCKSDNIYKMIRRNESADKIAEELVKCRYLCKSCHKQKTLFENRMIIGTLKRKVLEILEK